MLGSGGKTSLIAWLARELAREYPRVLLSTSTKVGPFAGLPLVEDPGALPAAFAGSRVAFLGRPLPAEAGRVKLGGLPDVDPAALRDLADVALIEADGARGRPLKVHLPHDPAVTDAADLAIVVVGASALAAPASEATVHRLERAPASWELRAGETPTPRRVARALLAPEGCFGKTGGVPTRMLINQAETWPAEAAALASALATVWPGAIVAGSAERGEFALAAPAGAPPAPGGGSPPAPVALVLAAAGRGERFGEDKRRFLLKGAPLLHWALGAFAGLPLLQRILVLGPGDEALDADARARGWQVALNPDPAAGLASSWQAGLAAVKRDAAGALLALADQPAIRRETLAALLAVVAASPARPLRPRHAGQLGHPYYLPRKDFPALLAAQGERVAAALPEPFPLDSADPGVILDLDRPDQAGALSALLPQEPEFHAV